MEIALSTQPDRSEVQNLPEGKVTYHKPRGSVIVALPLDTIRAKWVEIVSDLIRPERRGGAYKLPFTKALQAAWQPDFLTICRAMEKGEITGIQAWDVIKGGLPNLGNDPRDEVPLVDTWMWSDWERKRYFLCKVASEEPDLHVKVRYEKDGKVFVGPSHFVDYRTSLDVGVADLTNIENPDLVVHPNLLVIHAAEKIVPLCSPSDIIDPKVVPCG